MLRLAEEVYEKKLLDRLSDATISLIARIADAVRPGWSVRNKARLDEWKLMLYALNRSPTGIIGLILVLTFIAMGVLGPIIAPYRYNELLIYKDPGYRFIPPGGCGPGGEVFLLGTDDYGRDMLSLILYGARTSLVVAMLVMLIGAPIGIILGLVSGYYGGKIDEVIMRVTDIFLAFPGLILAIGFAATLPDRLREFLEANPWLQSLLLTLFALDPGDAPRLANLLSVVIAIVIVWWPTYTRIVRGNTLSVRENVFVEVAKAMGMSSWGIMFKHILPNILAPIIVILTLDIGAVILVEAGLSYLGIGAQPPIADWGRIVYDGSRWLYRGYWWLSLLPGLFILLTVLGFNLLGDALRDILDPKTRRSIEFKLKRTKR